MRSCLAKTKNILGKKCMKKMRPEPYPFFNQKRDLLEFVCLCHIQDLSLEASLTC